MLLGLLLQVQTVFACPMMNIEVTVEHCCCEREQSMLNQNSADDSCCELQNKLTLKEPDLDKDLPVIVQKPSAVELPNVAPYLLPSVIWPDDFFIAGAHVTWTERPNTSHPGTRTYLSTQRLRI